MLCRCSLFHQTPVFHLPPQKLPNLFCTSQHLCNVNSASFSASVRTFLCPLGYVSLISLISLPVHEAVTVPQHGVIKDRWNDNSVFFFLPRLIIRNLLRYPQDFGEAELAFEIKHVEMCLFQHAGKNERHFAKSYLIAAFGWEHCNSVWIILACFCLNWRFNCSFRLRKFYSPEFHWFIVRSSSFSKVLLFHPTAGQHLNLIYLYHCTNTHTHVCLGPAAPWNLLKGQALMMEINKRVLMINMWDSVWCPSVTNHKQVDLLMHKHKLYHTTKYIKSFWT